MVCLAVQVRASYTCGCCQCWRWLCAYPSSGKGLSYCRVVDQQHSHTIFQLQVFTQLLVIRGLYHVLGPHGGLFVGCCCCCGSAAAIACQPRELPSHLQLLKVLLAEPENAHTSKPQHMRTPGQQVTTDCHVNDIGLCRPLLALHNECAIVILATLSDHYRRCCRCACV
jgi:hypothetical protein